VVKAILGLLGTTIGLWQHKNATKYSRKLLALEKKYDEEADKNPHGRNVLDHIERDIVRLSRLVIAEIKGP